MAGKPGALVALACAAVLLAPGCFGPRGGALCDTPKQAPRPDRVPRNKAFLIGVAPSRSGAAMYVETATGAFQSLNRGRNWRRLGPGYNVLAIDPGQPERMVASGFRSLMWTDDGGRRWTRSELSRCATPYDGAALTPNPRLAYSWGGGGISSSDPWFGGVYRSEDQARSFERVASWEPNAVAVDPHDARTVYVATQGGIYRTTSAGSSWTEIGHGQSSDYWLLALAPSDSNVVYAVGDGTRMVWSSDGAGGNDQFLFRTRDGGRTWEKVLEIFNISGIAVDARNRDVVYVDAEKLTPRTDTSILLKTRDGGTSWQTLSAEKAAFAPSLGEASEPTGPAAPSGDLVADPLQPGLLYEQQRFGVAKSTDGGRTFQILQPPGWRRPRRDASRG